MGDGGHEGQVYPAYTVDLLGIRDSMLAMLEFQHRKLLSMALESPHREWGDMIFKHITDNPCKGLSYSSYLGTCWWQFRTVLQSVNSIIYPCMFKPLFAILLFVLSVRKQFPEQHDKQPLSLLYSLIHTSIVHFDHIICVSFTMVVVMSAAAANYVAQKL